MKVILINGSPHARGCTYTALSEVARGLTDHGVETEIIHIGTNDIPGCMGCFGCHKLGKCVIDDVVNEIAEKLNGADGMVIGSPVYFASRTANSINYKPKTCAVRPEKPELISRQKYSRRMHPSFEMDVDKHLFSEVT